MSHNGPQIGYNILSTLIASDASLNIFRSFKALNARNILYLQAELIELEETLQTLDEAHNDRLKGNDIWSIPRSWRSIKKQGGEYLNCVSQLRALTGKYYEALEAQSWLLNLQAPTTRARNNLRAMFEAHRSDMSAIEASFILDDCYNDDLVSISRQEKEAMSDFIEKYLYKAFEEKRIASHEGEMIIFSNHRIQSVVRVLAVLVSSILPILSIVILFFVKDEETRIGLIVLFSALCSLALATLSNARNFEIIAATAAFAAVQVVFVGNN